MSWWICSGLPSCLFAGLLSKCHWRLLRWCVFTCCQWFPNTLSAAFTVWPQCVWVRAESDHEGCCKWQSMSEDKQSRTRWSFFLNKTEVQRNIFFGDESVDCLLKLLANSSYFEIKKIFTFKSLNKWKKNTFFLQPYLNVCNCALLLRLLISLRISVRSITKLCLPN